MIGLIGNGSWATAIAKILTDNGQRIHWWMRKESAVRSLELNHHNYPYLSSISFDPQLIEPDTQLVEVIRKSEQVIFCVPSAYLKEILDQIPADALTGKWIISAVKGILPEVYQLLGDYLIQHYKVSKSDYLSVTGPCHAEEIAMERLSYLTFSCTDIQKAELVARWFDNRYLHTVVNEDVDGTQYAAVLKNIYALGAGIAHGLGYGDNFTSVYVTNCYKEMYLYVQQLSGGTHSLISSAYLGDLLVTCYSLHSRNRRLGSLLGQGYSLKAAVTEMGMIAEGYHAANGMKAILEQQGRDLPIVKEIYHTLWGNSSPQESFKKIESLLQ